MKIILERGLKELKGYYEMKPNTKFIYKTGKFEFFAIKIDDDYAAMVNGVNKFIIAQRYKNCLSIGSGYIREFGTFRELVEYVKKYKPTL